MPKRQKVNYEIEIIYELRRAQRLGVQLPRARCSGFSQKTGDLAREAVGWNGWLARLTETVQ
jgi:hypothetical protein